MTHLEYHWKGLPVRYCRHGKGPPLLMLHGWGSSSQVFLPLARKLGDLRTCYIPDLPGFGETAAPDKPWAVDDYADLAISFTREIIQGPTDILVHSFGGRVALKWCARKEDGKLVRQAIITGGAGMKPRRTLSYYWKRGIAETLKLALLPLPKALRKKAQAGLRRSALWKLLGSSDYRELDGIMRDTFVKTVSENLEPLLPKIPHEVLLLWGKQDPATPWYQAQKMEKGLPGGVLVGMDHAGHYAFLDQPDLFERIVRALLVKKTDEERSGVT